MVYTGIPHLLRLYMIDRAPKRNLVRTDLMKAQVIQINWHEDCSSILSIDFSSSSNTFCTGGSDSLVRIWSLPTTPTAAVPETVIDLETSNLSIKSSGTSGLVGAVPPIPSSSCCVQFICSLARHTKSVNCVRFSFDNLLASADDDGGVILWKSNDLLNNEHEWKQIGSLR